MTIFVTFVVDRNLVTILSMDEEKEDFSLVQASYKESITERKIDWDKISNPMVQLLTCRIFMPKPY